MGKTRQQINDYLVVAKCHLLRNEPDGAIAKCKEALRKNNECMEAHYYMAEAYIAKASKNVHLPPGEKKGWLKKAVEHSRIALRLMPNMPGSEEIRNNLRTLQQEFENY